MFFFFFGALLGIVLWVSYTDFLYNRIPNQALFCLVCLLPWHIILFDVAYYNALFCGIIGLSLIIARHLIHPNSPSQIGAGDLKLFGIGCFFTDLITLPVFMIATGLLGLCLAVFYQTKLKKKVFPLGPALMIALFGTIFYKFLTIPTPLK